MRTDDAEKYLTFFDVPLDDATVARLMARADESKLDPRLLISSILHDVLLDDELAHGRPGESEIMSPEDARKLN